MGRLAGKRAVVTGAGSDGIGRAVALGFAREGADVVIHHLAEHEAAAATVAAIRALGRRADAFAADFSSPDAARQLVREGAAFLGGIDILFCAAAHITRTPFLELTDAEVAKVMAVNVHGTFACVQQAARLMKDAGQGGRIIAVSSINQQKAMVLQSHYSASKGAIMQFLRTAAVELAPHGITCNLIAPAALISDFNREVMADDAYRERIASAIPLKRIGVPQDFVGAALFLASGDSDWVTASTVFVDGGRSAI